MSKREQHSQDLLPLFEAYLRDADSAGIIAYIVEHSNLPGPRGNLEMVEAFGDLVVPLAPAHTAVLWELAVQLSSTSAEVAPTNAPEEMLPVCGAVALGALGAARPDLSEDALAKLRSLACDPRWRTREGVCFGLQRLLAEQPQGTVHALRGWVADGDPLEMRAAAAAVAHPPFLSDHAMAADALALHQDIFDRFPGIVDRRSEPFRVLRKGLAFTLSVVTAAVPDQGFAMMDRLVVTRDSDVVWIVRENLKKKRLVKPYPKRVEELQAAIA